MTRRLLLSLGLLLALGIPYGDTPHRRLYVLTSGRSSWGDLRLHGLFSSREELERARKTIQADGHGLSWNPPIEMAIDKVWRPGE